MYAVRRLPALVVILAAILSSKSFAQATTSPQGLLSPAIVRRALDDGRVEEARQLSDRLVRQSPASRDAASVQIDSHLAAGDAAGGFAAYDRFAAVTKTQHPGLLAPLARHQLRAIAAASEDDPKLRCEAFERLARFGDEAAREQLIRLSSDTSRPGVNAVADAALARLGDSGAVARLTALAWSPDVRDKTSVVEGLALLAGNAGIAELRALLADPNPGTRIAAATALADRGDKDSVPAVRELLSDDFPEVRSWASLALKRLGDPSADAAIARMKSSPVAEARLDAVVSDRSAPDAERRAALKPYLTDPEPLVRLKAAKALLDVEPDAAREVLVRLAGDAGTPLRADAAALLEGLGHPDVALWRHLLADGLSQVRLHAAGGALKSAATAK
jgi:HEAT repeat protein